MVGRLPLPRGEYALVDDADFAWASRYSWSRIGGGNRTGRYVGRSVRENGRRTTRYLHREIVAAPDGCEVDHINGDGLDCRRDNLRLVTTSQNQQNQLGARADSTTGIRGVTVDKRKRKRFVAQLMLNGRHVHLGNFYTLEEAAVAARAGREKYFTHSTREEGR